jgi:calpain, invertebrate
MIYTRNPWGT